MVGAQIGSYKLVDFIARGEVSFVYKAYQPKKKEYFAVKIFRLTPTRTGKVMREFFLEVERVSRLIHPHILPIYEHGQQNNVFYVVTRYMNVDSLEGIMDEFRQPRHALTIVRSLASAMDFLHGKNIIHGNLKPTNILVDANSSPYLTSIGFASRLNGATTYGGYAAPEQATGTFGKQVDVYALGALMYEMLVGEQPLQTRPAALMGSRSGLAPELNEIILKALDPNPRKRYRSCSEFSERLASVIFPVRSLSSTGSKGAGGFNSPENDWPRFEPAAAVQQPMRRRRGLRLILVLLLLILSVFTIVYLMDDLLAGEGIYSQTEVSTITALVDANVRSGPGLEYPVIGILAQAESTLPTGISQDGQWISIYRPNTPSHQSWISAQVVEMDLAEELPVVDFPSGEGEIQQDGS